jgi:hypothetical protein
MINKVGLGTEVLSQGVDQRLNPFPRFHSYLKGDFGAGIPQSLQTIEGEYQHIHVALWPRFTFGQAPEEDDLGNVTASGVRDQPFRESFQGFELPIHFPDHRSTPSCSAAFHT